MQNRSRAIAATLLACALASVPAHTAHAQATTLDEGFEDIETLDASGWHTANLSAPVGILDWFQGHAVSDPGPPPAVGVFDAYDGPPRSYIGANFNSTGLGGTINNWLVTPHIAFGEGATFTFWTRTADPGANPAYPDRIEVRFSTSGDSTDVGSNIYSVGDFYGRVLTINPNLQAQGYPRVWTQYTITNAEGLPRNGNGRIAFRYEVPNAGPNAPNSDYIGIDRVQYEGGTPAYLLGGGVSGLSGTGLVLRNNGADDLAITADGDFLFPTSLPMGAQYDVTVAQQPSAPFQECTVANGSGQIVGVNALGVQVTCITETRTFAIASGNGQSADIDMPFAAELVVQYVDGDGAPIPGATVTFEAPLAGASALLDDNVQPPATTLTVDASQGEARAYVTANAIAGCYGVTASTPGMPSVVFELTNLDTTPPGVTVHADGFETSPARKKGLAVCQS